MAGLRRSFEALVVVLGGVVASVGCGEAQGGGANDEDEPRFAFSEIVRITPCLPRELPVAGDGAACVLTEARLIAQTSCDCEKAGMREVPSELAVATRGTLRREDLCDSAGAVACDSLCVCAVPQLHDELGDRCRSEPDAEDIAGWCYVAPGQGLGDAAQLVTCSDENRRELRLFGISPGPQRELVLSCYEP